MRKITLVVAVLLAAAGLSLAGPSPIEAGGGATSDVYAVHGLNLSDQSAQSDGGTPVTVCVNDADPGINPFEFGEIAGPLPVPTGASVNVKVYGGTESCASPGGSPLIDQTIPSVPAGTVALVATAGPNAEPGLAPFVLNTDCVDPGEGRLTGAHAANAGTVDVLVDGGSAGQLAFGESLDADLPAGTVPVQVNIGSNPIVGPLDLEILEANNRVVYVVGNQPLGNDVDSDETGTANGDGEADAEIDVLRSTVVPLVQDLPLEVCDTPTDPQPASDVVEATPTFTG